MCVDSITRLLPDLKNAHENIETLSRDLLYKIHFPKLKLDFRYGLSPPVKYFTDRSKAVLLCFCSVLCLLCLRARLFICALWSPAGKGLTSWLSFVVLYKGWI